MHPVVQRGGKHDIGKITRGVLCGYPLCITISCVVSKHCEFDIADHCNINQRMEQNDGSDIAVPEKVQCPASGNKHLDRHKKGFVWACLYNMFRQNIYPEKTMDQSAVYHEKKETCDKECQRFLCKAASKSSTCTENSIKHESFGYTVTNAEDKYSQRLKSSPSIGGRVGINPGIDCNDNEGSCQEKRSAGIEITIECYDILSEKQHASDTSQGPVEIDLYWNGDGLNKNGKLIQLSGEGVYQLYQHVSELLWIN